MNEKAARKLVAIGLLRGWLRFPLMQRGTEMALRREYETTDLADYNAPVVDGAHENFREAARGTFYKLK